MVGSPKEESTWKWKYTKLSLGEQSVIINTVREMKFEIKVAKRALESTSVTLIHAMMDGLWATRNGMIKDLRVLIGVTKWTVKLISVIGKTNLFS